MTKTNKAAVCETMPLDTVTAPRAPGVLWAAVAAFGLALPVGCWTNPAGDIDDGVALTCSTDADCPAEWTCLVDADPPRCISSGGVSAPTVTVDDAPSVIGLGQTLTLRFGVSEPLRALPALSAQVSGTRVPLAVDNTDEDNVYVATLTTSENDPEGTATFTADLVSEALGLTSTVDLNVQVVFDFTAPETSSASTVSPARVGASLPVDISVVTNEVLEDAPTVMLVRGEVSRAALLVSENETVFQYRYLAADDRDENDALYIDEGEYAVEVVAVDAAGNASAPQSVGTVEFDTTPPAIVGEPAISYRPAATALVNSASALAAQATTVIDFEVNESLARAPQVSIGGDRLFTANTPNAEVAFQFEYQMNMPLVDGAYDVSIELVDDVGNETVVTVAGGVVVDRTAPVKLLEGAANGFVLYRAPWGTVQSDGVPRYTLEASAGSVEPLATVIVWDEPAVESAVEIGRTQAQADGSVTAFALQPKNRLNVYVNQVDQAGNIDRDDNVAAAVGAGRFVASMRGKVVGSVANNPHHFEVRSDAPLTRLNDFEIVGKSVEVAGAIVGNRDGEVSLTRARSRWRLTNRANQNLPDELVFTGRTAAVFDSWRGQHVFSGLGNEQTWTLTSVGWNVLDTPNAPVPYSYADSALVFDARRGLVVSIEAFERSLRIAEFDGQTWRKLPPKPLGDAMYERIVLGMTATFDHVRNAIVVAVTSSEVYEGPQPGPESAKLYAYRGGDVVEIPTTNAPTLTLTGMSMVEQGGDLWLFGGADQPECDINAGCTLRDGLHRVDGQGAWTSVTASPRPPARQRAALMAAPDGAGLWLMAGDMGFSAAVPPNFASTLWTFENGQWSSSLTPLEDGNEIMTAAADPHRKGVLAFGLFDRKAYLLKDGTWHNQTSRVNGVRAMVTPLPSPFPPAVILGGLDFSGVERTDWTGYGYSPSFGLLPQQRLAATAFDTSRERIVLVGGTDDFGVPNPSTLIYDPVTGSQSAGPGIPGPRVSAFAAYHPVDDRVLVAGGFDSTSYDIVSDAWAYDPGTMSYTQVGNFGPNFVVAGMAWDAARQVMVLRGTAFEDAVTYEYSGGTFSEVSRSYTSTFGTSAPLAYDENAGEVVQLLAGALWRYIPGPAPRWDVRVSSDSRFADAFTLRDITLFYDHVRGALVARVDGNMYVLEAETRPAHDFHIALDAMVANTLGATLSQARVDWTAGATGGFAVQTFHRGAWTTVAESTATPDDPATNTAVIDDVPTLESMLGRSELTLRVVPLAASGAGAELVTDDVEVELDYAFLTATCGDGVVVPGVEECDDGNLTDDDGCNRACRIEASGNCSPVTGTCVPFGSPCPPEYIGDGTCDCGCGVVDSDCDSEQVDVGACFDNCATFAAEIDPDDYTACIGGENQLRCDSTVLGDGLLCDCGCGVYDVDCGDAFGSVAACDVSHCDAGEVLAEYDIGQCVSPLCSDLQLSDGICSCGCGIEDVDCPIDGFDVSVCNEDVCSPQPVDPANLAFCLDEGACPGIFDNFQCDCGCGVFDEECGGLEIDACVDNCPAGLVIDPQNIAQCIPPSVCDGQIGTGDGCTCGCGEVDPDCAGNATVADCEQIACELGFVVDLDDLSQCVPDPGGGACPGLIGAGDSQCDCGCGVFDTDCVGAEDDSSQCVSINCPQGEVLDFFSIGFCVQTDTCGADVSSNGQCNCGCNVSDPECPSTDDLSVCSTVGCVAPEVVNPTDTTTCTDIENYCIASWFDPGDTFCDCGCGLFDPICDEGLGIDACTAEGGYVACPIGQVVSASDITQCETCPDGEVPGGTRVDCVPCPMGLVPDAAGETCVEP